jgi:hypothetical protein
MGPFSNYDWVMGFEKVLLVFALFTIALVGLLSLQLFKQLQAQDSALSRGVTPRTHDQVLLIIRTVVLWVIGYRGEERERTRFADVDVAWMDRYWVSIVLRFVPVYAIYILALLVWTRPVFFADGAYHTFSYSSDLNKLFVLFVIYVGSNIFFDYNSLRITFSNFLAAQATGRYAYFFVRNLLTVLALFVPSQIISCILWIYKRKDPTFPALQGDLLHQFMEITTWPYAFATGPNATQIVSDLFPGQLLITGIVFFPTILLISLFVIYSAFLRLTKAIKKVLLSHKLDKLCRTFLRIRLIGIFEPDKTKKGFGYCNLAFLGLLDLAIVTTIGVLASRLT